MRNKKIIIAVVVIVVIAGGALLAVLIGSSSSVSTASTGASDASSTVAAFGQVLQQVSIEAPDAASTIASTYAPYVDPTLLSEWEADPTSAPGRVVSSPWPDHIQIDSVTAQGAGYVVDGDLVFMTSDNVENGGNAGTTPVVVQLEEENGSWMIVAFQGQATQ
jgi:hypothetical protein